MSGAPGEEPAANVGLYGPIRTGLYQAHPTEPKFILGLAKRTTERKTNEHNCLKGVRSHAKNRSTFIPAAVASGRTVHPKVVAAI
jgi:hypothetical protein